MNQSPPPFETMVFVCTHQRAPGERTACANPGREGLELLEGLRKMVQEKGLTGKVRICKSGCMDRCEEGPNVMVIPPQGQAVWMNTVSIENIESVYSIITKNA
jgi:(2Fe-2S) ferredoxin